MNKGEEEMGKCDRCGGKDIWTDDSGRVHVSDFTDYCAKCSKNLCAACMAKGCCGSVPTLSGNEADEADSIDYQASGKADS
jgi:hypothetical protein